MAARQVMEQPVAPCCTLIHQVLYLFVPCQGGNVPLHTGARHQLAAAARSTCGLHRHVGGSQNGSRNPGPAAVGNHSVHTTPATAASKTKLS